MYRINVFIKIFSFFFTYKYNKSIIKIIENRLSNKDNETLRILTSIRVEVLISKTKNFTIFA